MKRIGSLLTAGALALSLVTLPAGAAEAAPALEETAQAAAQAALTAGGGPEHPVRPVAGWGDHPHRATREIIPARRTAPSPMTFCTALAR